MCGSHLIEPEPILKIKIHFLEASVEISPLPIRTYLSSRAMHFPSYLSFLAIKPRAKRSRTIPVKVNQICNRRVFAGSRRGEWLQKFRVPRGRM